jgi:tetratricopeptide (TPR) repeat protein
MPTKLSRYCLGVMEAAWLAAVSIVPIFFNIYSSRIFEPDKITILRSLALLTLTAWIVKLIEVGGVKWKRQSQDISFIKYLWNYPMIAPVIGLILIYIIATIFSVTPFNSFFGSYQRLQGTYTSFSYLVIFFSLITNLRSRNQINRLVTAVILASLPVSLYGLLQRYHIDPIPWGGNVSIRIASNMGNSIFVAAYLIMVFPLTIGRIVEAFKEIINENEQEGGSSVKVIKQVIKATIYVFIGALELIAIYMSGSRGPLLGLMAAVYFLVLLLSIYWRKRWLTFTIIGLALFGAAFLTVFNIRNGPLDALKSSPAIGRFGLLLDPESNSALVRQYIWEGTVKLVGIHDPLKFPDGGSDPFNFLRPIIGYGPESMYVAYNQYYQPELGQVEKRNASPDRAHNETWDSIVITGFAGLLVYLSIFSSVFYYGLKWQGLIKTIRNKIFFIVCLIGGGVLGAISLIILKGIEFLGVGLPFGMIIGLVVYLTIYALFSSSQNGEYKQDNPYSLMLIFLFGAIVGHFVEINFGIAIVATRTLFWTYTGVLLVIGYILPKVNSVDAQIQSMDTTDQIKKPYVDKKKDRYGSSKQRHKVNRNLRPLIGDKPDWIRFSLVGAVIIGLIIATLGYDFVTNSGHSTSPMLIIINSVTQLSNEDNASSLGILALVLTTLVVGVFLFSTENNENYDLHTWLQALGLMSVASLVIGFLFWLVHAVSLATLASFTPSNQNEVITQVNSIGSLLTRYYIYVFLIIILVAFLLPDEWPYRSNSNIPINIVVVPIALIILFLLTNISNLKVIHADITFKMAEPFTKSSQWQVATYLYKRALELAPKEDHYYLFLGRSYLEQAKITDTTTDQDNLILQAEKDLKVAQSINPLNTDHTANLARLYSWWAGKATTATTHNERAQKASDYYQTSVTLSPNNSTLWDEWAVLFLQVIGQSQEALIRLQHALELDARYSFTQGLLGDYYLRIANSTEDITSKQQALQTATEYYLTAASVAKTSDQTSKASYLVALANVHIVMAGLEPQNIDRAQLQQAIDVLLESMDAGINKSDLWKVQEAVAKLYMQLGEKSLAQYYANKAFNGAPSSATDRIQDLITQTQTLP